MKTTATITLVRNGKTIVLYIKNNNWDSIPDLDFIADVEIYTETCKNCTTKITDEISM